MSPSCKIEQEKDFMVIGLLCLNTVSISNFFHFHAVFGKIFVKRETISVVCIPPAFVVLGEGVKVYPTPTPRIPYPHSQIPYPLDTSPPQKKGYGPGDMGPKIPYFPYEQNDCQTPPKTLPSRNYCCRW